MVLQIRLVSDCSDMCSAMQCVAFSIIGTSLYISDLRPCSRGGINTVVRHDFIQLKMCEDQLHINNITCINLT